MDSEKVMVLLKRQALKGKLVIINIHQPSSDLYKLIDKLLIIDKGGRIIYNGNPMDAIAYFKKMGHYVNPEERECYVCGNVKTEQPLRIIEARQVNPDGKFVRQRKVTPEEWYEHYIENFEKKFEWKEKRQNDKREKLPPNLYNIPGRWEQFKIYFLRDALSKLKDHQYLTINLLEAPILAMMLGFFTKYISGTDADASLYLFGKNVNLPAYLFMCVVVSLFMGLNVSAEEIIKDRRLLQRESFLNLSRSGFLNSKIVILFIISAIQTLSFVLIGNHILEVQGLTFSYWFILFSAACFANLLGLNISSGLNSVVAIYIMIPLILVPQLLFSGVIVNFDKLHKSIASDEYVPRIGDLMISRWAYEGLAVNQFKNNAFEKHFFATEQAMSEASYRSSLLIPELKKLNETCQYYLKNKHDEELRESSQLLFNELNYITERQVSYFPHMSRFLSRLKTYDAAAYQQTDSLLNHLKLANQALYRTSKRQKDSLYTAMINQYGSKEAFLRFKETYQNEAVEELVLNKRELKQILVTDQTIVQKKHPVFKLPTSNWGRAHFYAPEKRMMGLVIPTPLFNTLVIWLSTGLLYVALYLDVLRRIIRYFETFKLRRMNKKLQRLGT